MLCKESAPAVGGHFDANVFPGVIQSKQQYDEKHSEERKKKDLEL